MRCPRPLKVLQNQSKLPHDASKWCMQYEKYKFFQFLGVLCTQGPQRSAKNPNLSVKNWGHKSISRKPNLNQKSQEFYLWNHKFNVFKRFWKRKIKFFYPAKKSLIKAQFGDGNRFLGHFSSVFAEVAWFGCDFCWHSWG